jgi:hypothetical protein
MRARPFLVLVFSVRGRICQKLRGNCQKLLVRRLGGTAPDRPSARSEAPRCRPYRVDRSPGWPAALVLGSVFGLGAGWCCPWSPRVADPNHPVAYRSAEDAFVDWVAAAFRRRRSGLPEVSTFRATPHRPGDPEQTESRTEQACPERTVAGIEVRKPSHDDHVGGLLCVV